MLENRVEDALAVLDVVINHPEILDPSFEMPSVSSSMEYISEDVLGLKRESQTIFLNRLRSIL